MNSLNLPVCAFALLLAHAAVPQLHAAELTLPREGWASWQVSAAENAPAWCCWSSWKDRDVSPTSCRLDDRPDHYGTRSDEKTDSIKVYARVAGGRIDRLQVLSATCQVETRTPVNELGNVTVEDSARWLIARARQSGNDAATGNPISESALAALAMHRGDFARDALAEFSRDPRIETRKWAVFWLAQLRGDEGAAITSTVMFNDKDEDVRKHAAFALAQTKSPRAAADLIRQGNTDKVGDVRAQAWFWLAQTGAAEAEQAIAAALRKDADEHVREHAVFALSQLPDDRAPRALIATAEDQSLSREQRKRAVFWLSQSESDSAQAYLEKVLARNTAN
ncbi:MAG TPA: HEAT repeat domain-containing protein [Steroidobacteraceae bacterium]|nr:HEAT repeat domain-containing protein [Steroidobacteraceae bacterium]